MMNDYLCPIYLTFYCLLQDKSLSSGIFFLELLSSVEPRVVNWNIVTKGESGRHFSTYLPNVI